MFKKPDFMDNLWLGSNRFGLVFIENVRPGEYDAILMDIQMPHMNGYEATREIRRLAREDARQIPIVAMTADAFSSDIKMALNAGMNEHLSKPVSIERLQEVLGQWL